MKKSVKTLFISNCLILLLINASNAAIKLGNPQEFDFANNNKVLTVNDLTFTVTDAGEGPVIILLHGFPDSRHTWRFQIPALVDAGYRVIVPDLRGYGESSRPEGVENYSIDKLATDVTGILDALNIKQARIIGHDFGAGLAWYTAAFHPEYFTQLVAMSVGVNGNPGWQTVEQREKSWYFDFFNKEGIAEEALSAENFKLFRELIRNQGDPDRFFTDLARPGALTAALNWYRANTKGWGRRVEQPLYPMINIPVMGIWSEHDHHLLEPQMKQSNWNITGPWRYERIDGAGHWLMLEKPDEINKLLLDFLKK